MEPLPIDSVLSDIVTGLRSAPAVVIEAPPGAGKTTRVPRALLDAGFGEQGEILVLQPRRLPARLGATRVAAELGERVGERVGYTVRFDDVAGPRTRIRFLTEGVFVRQLLGNPTLGGISVVVLDEFHERHLAVDLALGWMRRRQLQTGAGTAPKLCVMSATMDAEPIAAHLGGCPRVRSEGRRFEVRVEHAPVIDDRPLATQVSAAVRELLRAQADGDVLVFLPGASEIRRCQEALAPLATAGGLTVSALHGDLSLDEQARAVAPTGRRKIILATNVAETSVTIEGVVAVVDSGLARIASHSPWTGLPTLRLEKISQASAAQRAGRAGRTRPGVAVRLYTRHDLESRRAYEVPEIGRLDLAEVVLALRALGLRDPASFPWLAPPPAAALAAAGDLLARLGAFDAHGSLGERGRRMLRFPVHPRLARVLVEGEDHGAGDEVAALAALISERDVRAAGSLGGERGTPVGGPHDRGIDLIALLELFEDARRAGFGRDRLRALGLDVRATTAADQARRQLAALLRRPAAPPSRPSGPASASEPSGIGGDAAARAERADRDRRLCRAALAGFPDRVARRRAPGSRTVLLAAGGTAELAYEPDSEFILALDVEERRQGARPAVGGATTTVRLGCGIDPDWLADLEGDNLQASETLELDQATLRVVRRSRLASGALVLDETVRPAAPSPEASRLLAEAALARGPAAFDEPGALSTLAARLELLSAHHPRADVPTLDEAGLRRALLAACEGLTSFAELRTTPLGERIVAALSTPARALLAAEAPTSVTLPGGRAVPVQYQPGQPPWIESRLQDFFGMARGPAIAGGRAPLTLHLLAPNGRAVQVTGDLDSFWRQHYPALRIALARRYPKHAWPEDGRTAVPPPPHRPRAHPRR